MYAALVILAVLFVGSVHLAYRQRCRLTVLGRERDEAVQQLGNCYSSYRVAKLERNNLQALLDAERKKHQGEPEGFVSALRAG